MGLDKNKLSKYEGHTKYNYTKAIADEIINTYGKPDKVTYYDESEQSIFYNLWYKQNGYDLVINISETKMYSMNMLLINGIYYMPENVEQRFLEYLEKYEYGNQLVKIKTLYDNITK